MGAWVYILRCADGSYYTGLTRQEMPETRLSEHMIKLSPTAFTARRLPVTLVYAEYLDLVADAIAAERKIKGWSRAKKEALIRGDWCEVQRLSKRRGGRERTGG
jgi:putative endonuclease